MEATRTPISDNPASGIDDEEFPEGEYAREEEEGGSTAALAGDKKETTATGSKGKTRLCFEQRKEVLELIDKHVSHAEIGRRFEVTKRTIQRIKNDRATIEKWPLTRHIGKAYSTKTSQFVAVEALVMQLIDAARTQAKLPVNSRTIAEFALKAKAQLLGGDEGLTERERIALERFSASPGWVKKFVRRHGYRSKLLAGSKVSSFEKVARGHPLEKANDALHANHCDAFMADVLLPCGADLQQRTAVRENGREKEKVAAEGVAGTELEADRASESGTMMERQFDQPPPFSGDLAAAWELLADTAARTGNADASWNLRKTKLAFMTAHDNHRDYTEDL